jgi:ParB-like nuclease domain
MPAAMHKHTQAVPRPIWRDEYLHDLPKLRVTAFVPGDGARSIPLPRFLVGSDKAREEFDDARRRRGLVSKHLRAINAIKVGRRHRRALGDIEALAKSISELGLLHPIVVNRDGILIAGERLLGACKKLGWKDVRVTVVDIEEIARGEVAKNAIRKDFQPTEIDAIRRSVEPLEKAAAKQRMSEGSKGAKVSQPSRLGPTDQAESTVVSFAPLAEINFLIASLL